MAGKKSAKVKATGVEGKAEVGRTPAELTFDCLVVEQGEAKLVLFKISATTVAVSGD
jgi:hypothetical protein